MLVIQLARTSTAVTKVTRSVGCVMLILQRVIIRALQVRMAHVNQDVVHRDYPGRQTTAANVAYPFSPKENSLGPVCEWNTWHLLPLDDPCEPFKIEVREFPIRK